MINAQELRIGNLIERHFKSSKPNKLLSTTPITIEEAYKFPKTYNPIPLTKEWLLAFGFETTHQGIIYKLKSIGFRIWRNGSSEQWHFFVPASTVDGFIVPLHNVHQLQNLYFTLTNSELTTV